MVVVPALFSTTGKETGFDVHSIVNEKVSFRGRRTSHWDNCDSDCRWV